MRSLLSQPGYWSSAVARSTHTRFEILAISIFIRLYSLAALLDQLGDKSCASRLVTRPDSGAVVAMEVFVEINQIAPVRVVLEFFKAPVDRAHDFAGSKEDACEASRDFRSSVT